MRNLDIIIRDIIETEKYCEISINQYHQKDGPEVTGYNGYEASRESDIESTDLGKELQAKLRYIYNKVPEIKVPPKDHSILDREADFIIKGSEGQDVLCWVIGDNKVQYAYPHQFEIDRRSVFIITDDGVKYKHQDKPSRRSLKKQPMEEELKQAYLDYVAEQILLENKESE